MQNPESVNVCQVCQSLRFGMDGWVCSACTFINANATHYCAACFEKKEGVPTSRKCRVCLQPLLDTDLMNTCTICRAHASTGGLKECRCGEMIPENESACIACRTAGAAMSRTMLPSQVDPKLFPPKQTPARPMSSTTR